MYHHDKTENSTLCCKILYVGTTRSCSGTPNTTKKTQN